MANPEAAETDAGAALEGTALELGRYTLTVPGPEQLKAAAAELERAGDETGWGEGRPLLLFATGPQGGTPQVILEIAGEEIPLDLVEAAGWNPPAAHAVAWIRVGELPPAAAGARVRLDSSEGVASAPMPAAMWRQLTAGRPR